MIPIIAMIIGAAMLLGYGLDIKRVHSQSPIMAREVLELQELCRHFLDSGRLNHREVIAALQYLENWLGQDVRRMRPSDKFARELAYLQLEAFDNDLDALLAELNCKFLLDEHQSEFLWTHMASVQDFVEIHAFLYRQIPGKVDLGSFYPKALTLDSSIAQPDL